MSDLLIRWSVRLALAGYAVRLATDWGCFGQRVTWQRVLVQLCWSLGCLFLALHIGLAFHLVHHWDHGHAYAETARRSAELTGWNSGFGVYLNEATLALWTLDVVWMLASPATYGRRSLLVGAALQAWLLFMAVNGAILFERGPTRWWALIVGGLIAMAAIGSAIRRRRADDRA